MISYHLTDRHIYHQAYRTAALVDWYHTAARSIKLSTLRMVISSYAPEERRVH
jgi:hypothetical protein